MDSLHPATASLNDPLDERPYSHLVSTAAPAALRRRKQHEIPEQRLGLGASGMLRSRADTFLAHRNWTCPLPYRDGLVNGADYSIRTPPRKTNAQGTETPLSASLKTTSRRADGSGRRSSSSSMPCGSSFINPNGLWCRLGLSPQKARERSTAREALGRHCRLASPRKEHGERDRREQ